MAKFWVINDHSGNVRVDYTKGVTSGIAWDGLLVKRFSGMLTYQYESGFDLNKLHIGSLILPRPHAENSKTGARVDLAQLDRLYGLESIAELERWLDDDYRANLRSFYESRSGEYAQHRLSQLELGHSQITELIENRKNQLAPESPLYSFCVELESITNSLFSEIYF